MEFNNDVDTTTLTLEHVSGIAGGHDFIDRNNGGAFSKTYAAFTYEFVTVRSGQNVDNFLVDMGVRVKILGLDFDSAIIFYAKNDQAFSNSTDYQLTLVGGYTNGNFTVDGFMDLAFGSKVESDIASLGDLKVGVEYSY
jgi:hypothetical protein